MNFLADQLVDAHVWHHNLFTALAVTVWLSLDLLPVLEKGVEYFFVAVVHGHWPPCFEHLFLLPVETPGVPHFNLLFLLL